jgi:hypothetical protein
MCTSRVVNLKKIIGPVQIESLNNGIKLRSYVMGEKDAHLSWTIAKICMILPYFYRILERARKLSERP